MKYSLDLTSYSCPLPLLMTKKAMNDLKKGDSLLVLLNKQSCLADFELLAKEHHCLIDITEQAVENRILFAIS